MSGKSRQADFVLYPRICAYHRCRPRPSLKRRRSSIPTTRSMSSSRDNPGQQTGGRLKNGQLVEQGRRNTCLYKWARWRDERAMIRTGLFAQALHRRKRFSTPSTCDQIPNYPGAQLSVAGSCCSLSRSPLDGWLTVTSSTTALFPGSISFFLRLLCRIRAHSR